jgi:SAM-dependent methyltransferase
MSDVTLIETLEQQTPRSVSQMVCPVCDWNDSSHFFISPDYLHGVPGSYVYVKCKKCRTVYQNPKVVSEDLQLCYPANYFTHEYPPSEAGVGKATISEVGFKGNLRKAIRHYSDGFPVSRMSFSLKILGKILSLFPSLRIRARYGLIDALALDEAEQENCLEIGPGQGTTLKLLSMIGWSAYGLDIDPVAVSTAQRVSGCEVRVSNIVNVDYPDNFFQMIYMSHVAEHLPDLAPSLGKCFRLLSPGGKLVMIYPNPYGLTARYCGSYSCVWDPPRHLVLPSGDACLDLLTRLGFECSNKRTLSRFSTVYRVVSRQYQRGIHGRGFSFGNRIGWRDRLFGAVESLLVLLGIPVGEEIVVVARKPRNQ